MLQSPIANACIHIVDDDEDVRRTLSYSVVAAGFATKVYPSAEHFVGSIAHLAPGCVVTDVRMPGMNGVELVRRLRAADVLYPVVVISGQADIELAVEAMKAGAADFLQKPFRSSALIEALRAALEEASSRGVNDIELTSFRKAVGSLSRRELEVLTHIVQGKLTKTVAHELGLSVRTVEGYRAEIMSKTQASTLGELVRMAVLSGL